MAYLNMLSYVKSSTFLSSLQTEKIENEVETEVLWGKLIMELAQNCINMQLFLNVFSR